MPVVKIYREGRVVKEEYAYFAGVVDIILDDGRTAQMVFNQNGDLTVRAWGNIPASLGNANDTSFRAKIAFEEKTSCERCYWPFDKCGCDPNYALDFKEAM